MLLKFIYYLWTDAQVLSGICHKCANQLLQKQKPSADNVKKIILIFESYGSVRAREQKKIPVVNNDNIKITIFGYIVAYHFIFLF